MPITIGRKLPFVCSPIKTLSQISFGSRLSLWAFDNKKINNNWFLMWITIGWKLPLGCSLKSIGFGRRFCPSAKSFHFGGSPSQWKILIGNDLHLKFWNLLTVVIYLFSEWLGLLANQCFQKDPLSGLLLKGEYSPMIHSLWTVSETGSFFNHSNNIRVLFVNN